MRRRMRWRWWGKWAATLATLLGVTAWVAGGWYELSMVVSLGRCGLFLSTSGGVGEVLVQSTARGRLEPRFWYQAKRRGFVGYHWSAFGFDATTQSGVSSISIVFPLWGPTAPLALVSAYLWYRELRRPRPGACSRCGYDLAGVTGGVCPECGAGLLTKP